MLIGWVVQSPDDIQEITMEPWFKEFDDIRKVSLGCELPLFLLENVGCESVSWLESCKNAGNEPARNPHHEFRNLSSQPPWVLYF